MGNREERATMKEGTIPFKIRIVNILILKGLEEIMGGGKQKKKARANTRVIVDERKG